MWASRAGNRVSLSSAASALSGACAVSRKRHKNHPQCRVRVQTFNSVQKATFVLSPLFDTPNDTLFVCRRPKSLARQKAWIAIPNLPCGGS
jgi:hypothetical protein